MSELVIPRYGTVSREEYAELGFKSGLEIHQQLYTEKKLFCHCPAGLYTKEHDAAVLRHMRPTLSELGEYDGTALMEFKKRKDVIYLLKNESVCTYEMDDTPPFMINQNALDIAMEIALLLNCSIVGELHIIRKQYLDGSIPTGFQRTAIVGLNGWIPYEHAPNGKVRIRQLAIEEDSCREVSDEGHTIIFRTDRLSMPLIEIVTEPDMLTPDDCANVGRRLAMLTRSTGKIRRGLGAARQDVNVSIEGGTRIEIKGVPQYGMIPKLTHYEAYRQKAFLDLQKKIEDDKIDICDKTFIVKDIEAAIVDSNFPRFREAMQNGGMVKAIKVENFGRYGNHPVHPDRVFMDEVAGIVKVVACLDEMPNLIYDGSQVQEIRELEFDRIRNFMDAREEDMVVIVAGDKMDVETAIDEIKTRITQALEVGVPNETRRQIADGTTRFERVLPGPDRMYPDTDLPPLSISEKRIERVQSQMPEFPWNRRNRYRAMGVSDHLIDELFIMNRVSLFEKYIDDEIPFSAPFLAKSLTETYKALKREGYPVDNLSEDAYRKLIDGVDKGYFSKDASIMVLALLSKKPELGLKAIVNELEIPEIDEDEVPELVTKTFKESIDSLNYSASNGNGPDTKTVARRFIMGKIMHSTRGRIDGELLNDTLEEVLDENF